MKKLVTMFLALAMMIGFSAPLRAFASDNPNDIAGHSFAEEITRLDAYGVLSSLMLDGRFYPNEYISQREFCEILSALFPNKNLGVDSNSSAFATMGWCCLQLAKAGRVLGYNTFWDHMTGEQLTRAKACLLFCVWLDSSSGGLRELAERVVDQKRAFSVATPTTTQGFLGPDEAWYDQDSGYDGEQSGEGFWYEDTKRWYSYQCDGNHKYDNSYGYWQDGAWWSYDTLDGVSSKCPFNDIQGWESYRAVTWMYNHGIAAGTSATTFSPELPCTEAHILTFLWRANGKPTSDSLCSVPEVSQDSYYYDALCWAEQEKITADDNGGVDPAQVDCTRATMVSFLWKTAGSPAVDDTDVTLKFTDVDPDSPYWAAVIWAVKMGITKGTSETTFSPLNPVTRGQTALFLYRTAHV